jgi:predicted nucleotidyltransferase
MDERLRHVLVEVERHYGERLLAAALFGSRARPNPRADADWDLLVVLRSGEAIRRSLYEEWARLLEPRVEPLLGDVSPKFVHLPELGSEPTGLWLEIATAHQVLSDGHRRLAGYLAEVRRSIELGRFESSEIHGIRYWRRAG